MQACLISRILLPLCLFYLSSLVSFSQSFGDKPNHSLASPPSPSTIQKATLTYKIINTPNRMYGYDVLVNGKIFIHQTNIPALAGNVGFKSKKDATKVALLVIDKMKQGQIPPSLTVNELRELKVTE